MRNTASIFFFLSAALFSNAPACAQSLSIGVVGGAPFEDLVKSGNFPNNVQSAAQGSNFTIGAAGRVNLPLSLRLEVDALYRPYSASLNYARISNALDGGQWRFPVLLQYRFRPPVIKPFISGGISFDRLSGLTDAARSIPSGAGTLLHTSAVGVVLGAGVDVKVPLLTISGELRYTRDTVSHFRDISNLNQAEALIGIHF